ncbi:M61 family peptidase [Alteromonas sediminis]|uniref:M61 family peptidase n=1 Tax=Alteromonas sediminis TaxID=2259342 RepID=A0A3N5Y1K6_9ALTE|nr:PDZ domain-containing protein [Alteromonas sediminis]RPJ67542.1 M61 family peptidase [Alteromonas sediminis]
MITYQVSLASVSLQTLHVSMSIPACGETTTLTLPSWIPGSYKIRDFAKNIGEFTALSQDNTPLTWQKLDKQTWQINTEGKACTVYYTVVANDYSVRGAFISDEYAFFNGTSTFLQVKDQPDMPYSMQIDENSAPMGWETFSSMPEVCADYYEFIDHPVYWGKGQVKSFTVKGVDITLLFSGTHPLDIDAICQDLAPICAHHLTLFGAPYPIENYLFITLLADTGYGGLEHRHSTVLMYPRFDLPMKGENRSISDNYIDFLSLCSHEFFHTWHVKRLRPSVMLQPDLSREVYTPQLWIYEGFTSFYDDLAVARAGKMSPEHYCTVLGRHITRLLHTPGRHKQSVAASSFEAWTRFYQQDAHSNNHIVSYYTKGGIIALGLDIILRVRSDNKVSMDILMQTLWNMAGRSETGSQDDIILNACDSLNVEVRDYLDNVVEGTEDVDLDSLLPKIGLKLNLRPRSNTADKGGVNSEQHPKYDFGVTLAENTGMGCKVTQLQENSAADHAGLQVGDIVVAVDGWVANETLWRRLLTQSEAESLSLSVARQGRLINLHMPVQPSKHRVAFLTIENRERYLSWLGRDEAE